MARKRPADNATPHQLSLDDWAETIEAEAATAAERVKRQDATGGDKGAGIARRMHSATDPTGAEPHAVPKATLLTTSEAARLLHVHPRTVQRLVERGELSAIHLGSAVRFDPDDVGALVERVKQRSAPAVSRPIRRRRYASGSFAERLRSRKDEHRAAQA